MLPGGKRGGALITHNVEAVTIIYPAIRAFSLLTSLGGSTGSIRAYMPVKGRVGVRVPDSANFVFFFCFFLLFSLIQHPPSAGQARIIGYGSSRGAFYLLKSHGQPFEKFIIINTPPPPLQLLNPSRINQCPSRILESSLLPRTPSRNSCVHHILVRARIFAPFQNHVFLQNSLCRYL